MTDNRIRVSDADREHAAACLAGIFAATRLHGHIRRDWQSGDGPYWVLGR